MRCEGVVAGDVMMRCSAPRAMPASDSSPATCRSRSSRGVVGRWLSVTSTRHVEQHDVEAGADVGGDRGDVVDLGAQAFEHQAFGDQDHRLRPFEGGQALQHLAHPAQRVLRLQPLVADDLAGFLLDFDLAPRGLDGDSNAPPHSRRIS